jgi:hypothetical protein
MWPGCDPRGVSVAEEGGLGNGLIEFSVRPRAVNLLLLFLGQAFPISPWPYTLPQRPPTPSSLK